MRRRDRGDRRRRGAGFTLVELLVVIAIIGLIIALVLVAASDGVRRAEERATQALITKITTGLEDRIDALLNAQAPVNQTHRYLASINYLDSSGNYYPVGLRTSSQSDERRAQVIAQFDYMRAELPDVFFIQQDNPSGKNTSDGSAFNSIYPLNFAAAPYPPGNKNLYNYVVPLGVGYDLSGNLGGILEPTSIGSISPTNQLSVTGMFGASFSAAGGLYKNLYAAAAADMTAAGSTAVVNAPLGYDGVDNNGNNYIDDLSEASASTDFSNAVMARLAKHTHKTARAEMLYAVLVEGLGPLGSVFNRDEFTAREVQDTDGDGLPEFVDAWGEPLQFYRWPIYYGGTPSPEYVKSSDSQKGNDSYTGYTETRELDPLDPNQLLVGPGWWYIGAGGNPAFQTLPNFTPPSFSAPNGPSVCSPSALAFMNYFHILVDPNQSLTAGFGWDRTGTYLRRAFFSKFLILSGGPDKEPGVGRFARDYAEVVDANPSISKHLYSFPNNSSSVEANALSLIFNENQAAQFSPLGRTGSFLEVCPTPSSTPQPPYDVMATTLYIQGNAKLDDISNHNIQAPSTGVR